MTRLRMVLALLLVAASIWVLERARLGVDITHMHVGDTPVTSYSLPLADGPVVVIAHGFAGSSQMMQGYALPLARAGYQVHVFDFLGHGRHSQPMSGDVTSVDGTTRLLVEQTSAVIDAVKSERGPVALVGHSMATDVLVRVAQSRADVGPIVLLSAFSREIDASSPPDLLLVTGAWEPGLRAFALEALQMVKQGAGEGDTAKSEAVVRRAVVAPGTEHVSILHSRLGRQEAIQWLDRAFDRSSDMSVLPTGPAIVGLLLGLVLLFRDAAKWLPLREVATLNLSRFRFAMLVFLPVCLAPPLATLVEPDFLPVLVADYLAMHLAIYGALQLTLLGLWRMPLGPFSVVAFTGLALACAVIGFALDRYAANFWPSQARVWVMVLMALGAMLFFVADARLSHRVGAARRFVLHGAFLVSLGVAVALDFEGLFFLLMIAPVVVLFFLVFGTLGHAVSARAGPLAPGVGLGLMLAWALGVSFPLFSA